MALVGSDQASQRNLRDLESELEYQRPPKRDTRLARTQSVATVELVHAKWIASQPGGGMKKHTIAAQQTRSSYL